MKSKMLIVLFLTVLTGGISMTLQAQEETVEPFLGSWALTLDYTDNNAGWLEVRQEEGYIDSDLLWRSGSVTPVDFTMVNGEILMLFQGREEIRKKDADGNPVRTTHPVWWFKITKAGADRLEGVARFPHDNGIGLERVSFTGKRIPPCGPPPDLQKIRYGEPVTLFNGKDLGGWKLVDRNSVSGWKVKDGVLYNNPAQPESGKHIHYGNLRTTGVFEDFNLKLEVNVPEGSNSGIYLRGIYEIQVYDSYGMELDSHNLGALYSRITPSVAAEKPAGEWQSLDITLYKRYLTVVLNGKTIIDNQPVKGVTGGALTSDDFSPGPVYLQGDHGEVSYRNMALTPVIQ